MRPTQGVAPLAQPCQPLAQNQAVANPAASGPIAWQNRLLHHARAEMGGEAARVSIQPFEALTWPRWEFHLGTKSIFTGHRDGVKHFAYDCTHFCYSPSFWDASFNDMAGTLAAGGAARLWGRRGARA